MQTHGTTTFEGRSYDAWTASNGVSVLVQFDPRYQRAEVMLCDAVDFVDKLYRLGPEEAGPLPYRDATVYGPEFGRGKASISLSSRQLETAEEVAALTAVLEVAEYYRDFLMSIYQSTKKVLEEANG